MPNTRRRLLRENQVIICYQDESSGVVSKKCLENDKRRRWKETSSDVARNWGDLGVNVLVVWCDCAMSVSMSIMSRWRKRFVSIMSP
jgi:hypothetical protein